MIRVETPGELLVATKQPVAWLMPEIAPAGALVLLTGAAKVGKSLVAADLAVAVATGTAFLESFRAWEGYGVLFLTLEPRFEVAQRIAGALAVRGESDAALLRLAYDFVDLTEPDGQRSIVQLVETWRPRMLVIDDVGRFTRTASTSTGAVAFRGLLTDLSNRHGVTTVLTGNVENELSIWGPLLRSWAQLHLVLCENPQDAQLMLTTPARSLARMPPLLRLAFGRVPIAPALPIVVPWPAEPLPPTETRIYDLLRQRPQALSKLRPLVHVRYGELREAVVRLRRMGLIESMAATHPVGTTGRRDYTIWRALPPSARRIDDPLADAHVRHQKSTGEESLDEKRRLERDLEHVDESLWDGVADSYDLVRKERGSAVTKKRLGEHKSFAAQVKAKQRAAKKRAAD